MLRAPSVAQRAENNIGAHAMAKSLFAKAEAGHAHLKAGIMGLAGSGKTYTASTIAIGLVDYMDKKGGKAKRIAAFVDTENGAAWVAPRFEEAKINLQVARTRSLVDLADAIDWASKEADVLIIDSITHFWQLFCDEYAKKKNRQRGLEFSDWNYIKREWRERFTDRFLNSPLHIIMCGRQGFEYEMNANEAGKKELQKVGVKMKAEGETGYEPSLLILMEQDQTLDNRQVTSVDRVATVLKDRSTKLDGKVLRNPAFKDFLPHIAALDIGGGGVRVDTGRDNSQLIPEEGEAGWKHRETQRTICLEEIQEELVRQWPGQDKEAKAAKGAMVERLFGTRSWTAVETKSLAVLQAARNKLWLETRGHEYGKTPDEAPPLKPNGDGDFASMTPSQVESKVNAICDVIKMAPKNVARVRENTASFVAFLADNWPEGKQQIEAALAAAEESLSATPGGTPAAAADGKRAGAAAGEQSPERA
jgi:hypothetical protein